MPHEAAPSRKLPPFSQQDAEYLVKVAEARWNTRDPKKIVQIYTPNCYWEYWNKKLIGHEQIIQCLEEKFAREHHYRLEKTLFCYQNTTVNGKPHALVAVEFMFEWYDSAIESWMRSMGNEHWTFNQEGFMKRRIARVNDLAIRPDELQLIKPPLPITASSSAHISDALRDHRMAYPKSTTYAPKSIFNPYVSSSPILNFIRSGGSMRYGTSIGVQTAVNLTQAAVVAGLHFAQKFGAPNENKPSTFVQQHSLFRNVTLPTTTAYDKPATLTCPSVKR